MKSARTIFFAAMIFFVGSSAHAQSVPLLNYDLGSFLDAMKIVGIDIWGIGYSQGDNNNWNYKAHFGNNERNVIIWVADNSGAILSVATAVENTYKDDFYLMSGISGRLMRMVGLNPTEFKQIHDDVFQQAKQAESQSPDKNFSVKSSVWCSQTGRYIDWDFFRRGNRYFYLFNAHV